MPGVLQGNLGYTLSTRRPVAEEIVPRIGPTLLLMALLAAARAPGRHPVRACISAVRQYGRLDYLLTSVTMLLISTPTFVLGLILIYIFGVTSAAAAHRRDADAGQAVLASLDLVGHMVMPALILGFANAAPLMRYTRASMLEVLDSEYVTTARAKGLRSRGSSWSATGSGTP